MAHILIATANPTQRRDFAAMLKAARHHVVTTDDAALALAALRETTQPLIVLLGEQLDPLQSQGNFRASNVLIHALESQQRTAVEPQHAYILLTQQQPDALPARVRAHLASRKVTLLSPNCTISDLLEAVEDAIARRNVSLTSVLALTVLAIAFQQRRLEAARQRQRQINDHSAKHGRVLASLRRTTSSAWLHLDSAHDAIVTTKQLLRSVRGRTTLSALPSQSTSPLPLMAHMHAIQRQGAY